MMRTCISCCHKPLPSPSSLSTNLLLGLLHVRIRIRLRHGHPLLRSLTSVKQVPLLQDYSWSQQGVIDSSVPLKNLATTSDGLVLTISTQRLRFVPGLPCLHSLPRIQGKFYPAEKQGSEPTPVCKKKKGRAGHYMRSIIHSKLLPKGSLSRYEDLTFTSILPERYNHHPPVCRVCCREKVHLALLVYQQLAPLIVCRDAVAIAL